MKLRFKGKRAVILGGSSELGLVISRLMIDEGIFPLLTARNEEREKFIRSELEDCRGFFSTRVLHLENRDGCRVFFDNETENWHYWVDLVNDRTEYLTGSIPDEKLIQCVQTQIAHRGVLIKAAVRHMLRERFGRMIYLSSTAALRINPGQGFYTLCKQSMEALYRSVGVELGSKGITSAILRPGYIDTGRGRPFLMRHPEIVTHQIPIRRPLTKEEVAETILFLLSDSASGINASALTMDGGFNAMK